MSVQEIYILFMTVLIIVIIILVWRISYIYRKQKVDLSRAILKIGEDKIDSEIEAMDLKQLIDHANLRNQQSGDAPANADAKSDKHNGSGDDSK